MHKLPALGSFATSSHDTIALCERARAAAPHGGFVEYLGHKIKITHVRYTRVDGEVRAVVSYTVVKS